jgi:dienelactone hydrolase
MSLSTSKVGASTSSASRKARIWPGLFHLAIVVIFAPSCLAHSESLKPNAAPWNLKKLFITPSFEWVKADGPVRALIYTGGRYKGKPTKVFAYYASPSTIDVTADTRNRKYPGIVLIHGGGGTANPKWVELWAKRGYAAIAMDLSGHRADKLDKRRTPVRMDNGGPELGSLASFDTIGHRSISDDWPYHAVANGILAHSLLRSFLEVDANRTAVTGISWGGYTTCMVASIDYRFKAAVPVYGCGFLHENSAKNSVMRNELNKIGPEKTKLWVSLYDPSSYLPKDQVPMLFVGGTNDQFFSLNSFMKSYKAIPRMRKYIHLQVNMMHNNEAGWAPKEIGWFIDSVLGVNGEKPLPAIGEPQFKGRKVIARIQSPLPISAASLNYEISGKAINEGAWAHIPAKIEKEFVTAQLPPAVFDMVYFDVTDNRGATVSSVVKMISRKSRPPKSGIHPKAYPMSR